MDHVEPEGQKLFGKSAVGKFEGEFALIVYLLEIFEVRFPREIAHKGGEVKIFFVIIIVNVGANDILAEFLHGVEHSIFAE